MRSEIDMGPETIKHQLKKDRYSRARGGTSEFLDIYCSSCNAHIALYQKDGKGSLIRMYLDRIFEPVELAGLQEKACDKKSTPNLNCPSCESLIATPMIYNPENRLALRMIKGKFYKKKSDGTYTRSK